MSREELRQLGLAQRDPAVTLLALVPLALLHLGFRGGIQLETFFLVESTLTGIGRIGEVALWILLVGSLLWAIGRIRQLELAWAGAGAMILLEGLVWALVLGPGLSQLTHWLPLETAPLSVLSGLQESVTAWNKLAIAAGAGLYEELLFRGLGLGGLALLLRLLFRRVAASLTADRLAFLLALLLSSAAFALAHGLGGHTEALAGDILAFRILAGLAFGLLYAFRGLAVAAYSHFAYDALYLLT